MVHIECKVMFKTEISLHIKYVKIWYLTKVLQWQLFNLQCGYWIHIKCFQWLILELVTVPFLEGRAFWRYWPSLGIFSSFGSIVTIKVKSKNCYYLIVIYCIWFCIQFNCKSSRKLNFQNSLNLEIIGLNPWDKVVF